MYDDLGLALHAADEWASAVVWSLTGLDLTLWLIAKGALLCSADLLNVLMMA